MKFFSYFSLRNIKLFLKVAGTKIYETVIKQILLFALQETKQYALGVAQQVTSEIAADPSLLTDSQKRGEAYKRIKEQAEKDGKELSDSVINFAIEAAVTAFKERTGG